MCVYIHICIYIYIYIYTCRSVACAWAAATKYYSAYVGQATLTDKLYILQRGLQWKQGVVIYMLLCTSSLYDTDPIHCTPLPLHPM